MALIGTLRERMGTWVVVFVFVAIAAFILGDFLSGNSNILNWGRNSVGEIAGREISIDEYQNAIQEREASFIASNGMEPSERDMISIRQQAWDMLVARHAITPQIQKVGVKVSNAEFRDMIDGKNVFDGIRQAFVNQATGEFDRNQLNMYLSQIASMPPNDPNRLRWTAFEKDLIPARERIKYENLLLKTTYVTKAEAEREYHSQTDVAEVKYLYVPYYTSPDTTAVADSDLQDYYNKNKERFRTEATRSIKYVVISVAPSSADSARVREDLARDIDAFKNSQQDSIYATNNSDGPDAFGTYSRGNLPPFIEEDQLTEGNVIGPVLDGDTYRIVKVSKVFKDTTESARASHILIRSTDASDAAKAEAKEKARSILAEIKKGADFAEKAREHGTDGTRDRGGDLGWFTKGRMVKPFEDAVFSMSKAGLVNDVVETDFGYHIIKVTEAKTNAAYKIAVIERQIVPSDESLNDFYRTAENFQSGLSSISEFEKRAREQGFVVQEAKDIQAGDRRIGSLGEAREIVKWLFRDASVGKVSEIFDVDDQHVVAVMTEKVEAGYRPLAAVKAQITPEVRKQRSAKRIIEKLKSASGSTLEEVAAAYGNDANVYSSSDLRLSATSLPTAGFDPKAIGAAFALESGKRSQPIEGENGVLIFEVQNKTVAPELPEYSSYKTQLEQSATTLGGMNIAEAIKEKSEIEDERYKFY